MLMRHLLLASAAIVAIGVAGGPAEAQKLKPFIVDNMIYSDAEFKALSKGDQNELKALLKIEAGAYKAIFSAASRGNFSKVTQAQFDSLISDPTVAFFDGDNTMDVTAANITGDDPVAFAGLDRFIGGSNTGVKFSLSRFLPTLRDSQGTAIEAANVNSVTAGKGGLKTSQIDYDDVSGDVSVTLRPSKKAFARNQYVNLNVNIDNVGPVQVTYWLAEPKPNTKFVFESSTLYGSGGSFSVNANEFQKNGDTDAFDPTILPGKFIGDANVPTTVTSVTQGRTATTINGVAPGEFAGILGLMTNGKLIRSSYGSFVNASPSS